MTNDVVFNFFLNIFKLGLIFHLHILQFVLLINYKLLLFQNICDDVLSTFDFHLVVH